MVVAGATTVGAPIRDEGATLATAGCGSSPMDESCSCVKRELLLRGEEELPPIPICCCCSCSEVNRDMITPARGARSLARC